MYRMVIDTETLGDTDNPLCYDIGYAIMDSNGSIVESRRHLVRETFFYMRDRMGTCYYAEKLPLYYGALMNGLTDLPLVEIRQELIELCKQYNIKQVWAFNAAFDRRALNYTAETVSNGFVKWFMPYGVEWHCIQAFAGQTILNSRTYFKYAITHGLVSEKGNVRTTAEATYQYIADDESFTEEHTALSDVLIECQILFKCLKQHTKANTKPSRSAWRFCQEKFKNFVESPQGQKLVNQSK